MPLICSITFSYLACSLVASTSRWPLCSERLESSRARVPEVNWSEDKLKYCNDGDLDRANKGSTCVPKRALFLCSRSTSVPLLISCRIFLRTVPFNWQSWMFNSFSFGKFAIVRINDSPAFDRSWLATSSPMRWGQYCGSSDMTQSSISPVRPDLPIWRKPRSGSRERRDPSSSPYPRRSLFSRIRTWISGDKIDNKTSFHPALRLVSRMSIFNSLCKHFRDVERWCAKVLLLDVLSAML